MVWREMGCLVVGYRMIFYVPIITFNPIRFPNSSAPISNQSSAPAFAISRRSEILGAIRHPTHDIFWRPTLISFEWEDF